MRAKITIIYRVILGLAGLSVGVLQVLVGTKAVHWSPWTVVSIASGVGGVAFLDNMRSLRIKYQAAERNSARTTMQPALITALHLITKERDVDLLSLGASVFNIRRYWTLRWIVMPWREQRLHRILRSRLSDRPQESRVKWTRGKGAIGECWAQNLPVLHDRRATIEQFGRDDHPTDDLAFSQLTREQHCGLTREEFVQTIDKYGEILALPIVMEQF